MSDAYEKALTKLEDIIDELEAFDGADDFRESLAEKCAPMREWYRLHGDLTERQMLAIENMIDRARKWARDWLWRR